MLQLWNTAYAKRHDASALAFITISLLLACSSAGCRRSVEPQGSESFRKEAHGWVWWVDPSSGPTPRGESKLAYQGNEVHFPGVLITPFGTLVQVRAEDQYSGSGWAQQNQLSSLDIPYADEEITDHQLQQGFYASGPEEKLKGTPSNWVYAGRIVDPGWVSPETLNQSQFREEHPYDPRGFQD